MYCPNCGKELSDVALMCPNCGTPTNLSISKKSSHVKELNSDESQNQVFAVIGFILSMIAFAFIVPLCVITPMFAANVDSSFLYAGYYIAVSPAFAPIITVFGILTALLIVISFLSCLIWILKTGNTQQRKIFNLSVMGLVFSSFEMLLFCFVFFLVPAVIFIG